MSLVAAMEGWRGSGEVRGEGVRGEIVGDVAQDCATFLCYLGGEI